MTPDIETAARAYINQHAPWYQGRPDQETLRQAREWAVKFVAEYAALDGGRHHEVCCALTADHQGGCWCESGTEDD